MIQKKTGNIILNRRFIIGPKLTREQFINSELGKNASVLTKNEPWCSFLIKNMESSGLIFSFILHFDKDHIHIIRFSNNDPKFGTNWTEWSKEHELKRKKTHDRWLFRMIGFRRKFSWGKVLSVYDERTGGSSIIVNYYKGKNETDI